MKHHLSILIAVLFACSSSAQEHAPMKEQCLADMKAWLEPMSHELSELKESMNKISAKELSKRRYEMAQCHTVDLAHSDAYDTVSRGYDGALENRMEDFIRRHPNLMDQFLKEDAASDKALLSEKNETTPQKADGMALLRGCLEPGETLSDTQIGGFDFGYCRGVVRGVSFWLLPKGCSDDVSVGQRVLVVNKYLKDHPEDLNLPDALLVSTALSKAFPCPTSHIK